jgi:hypothetical protein
MSAPPPVKLRYIATIASDSSFILLATGVALLTASSSPAVTAVGSPPASDSPSQQTTAGGLSPGAAAGIALGAILGFIVLPALGGFFIWRANGRAKLIGSEKSQYVYRPALGDAEKNRGGSQEPR